MKLVWLSPHNTIVTRKSNEYISVVLDKDLKETEGKVFDIGAFSPKQKLLPQVSCIFLKEYINDLIQYILSFYQVNI